MQKKKKEQIFSKLILKYDFKCISFKNLKYLIFRNFNIYNLLYN